MGALDAYEAILLKEKNAVNSARFTTSYAASQSKDPAWDYEAAEKWKKAAQYAEKLATLETQHPHFVHPSDPIYPHFTDTNVLLVDGVHPYKSGMRCLFYEGFEADAITAAEQKKGAKSATKNAGTWVTNAPPGSVVTAKPGGGVVISTPGIVSVVPGLGQGGVVQPVPTDPTTGAPVEPEEDPFLTVMKWGGAAVLFALAVYAGSRILS